MELRAPATPRSPTLRTGSPQGRTGRQTRRAGSSTLRRPDKAGHQKRAEGMGRGQRRHVTLAPSPFARPTAGILARTHLFQKSDGSGVWRALYATRVLAVELS